MRAAEGAGEAQATRKMHRLEGQQAHLEMAAFLHTQLSSSIPTGSRPTYAPGDGRLRRQLAAAAPDMPAPPCIGGAPAKNSI